MISTAEIVESLVRSSPLIETGLERGIISYSALARELKPQIKKKLMKDVTRGAIVMALKRVSSKLKRKSRAIIQTAGLTGLTVRSNLVELVYLNSDTIAEKHKKVFALSEKHKGVFCNLSQGVRETMVVVGDEIQTEVEKIFQSERLISRIKNISSITALLTKEIVTTPGAYYYILKLFSWENINVIDVISTYSELTIFFASSDIDKAFTILRNYQNK